MMRMAVTAAVAVMLGSSGTALAAGDPAVEAFEASQQASWNAGDVAAYTAAFAPDADIITASGWHWAGRDEAARMLGDGFKLVYAHSRLRLTVAKVRALSPDLLWVSLDWSLDGARTLDGASPLGEQKGMETQLLRRDGDRWIVLSQQDTAITAAPPAPSAQAAPSSAQAAPSAAPAFPTTPPPTRRCVLARANGDCLIYGKPKPAAQ